MKKILAILTIFAAFSTSAMAFDVYLGGALGVFQPNGKFEDGNIGVELDYELSYSGAIDLHIYLNDYIGIHGTLNGMYQETESVRVAAKDYKIKSFSGMAGVGLAAKVPVLVFDLYANAGVGWVRSSMDMEVKGGSYDDIDAPSTVGFYGDLGVRFTPIPLIYVGANARYIYAKKDVKTPLGWEIKDYDLGGFAFMVNAGIKF